MNRIEVGRYKNSESLGWAGWIHPEREEGETVPEWVLFITTDGHVTLGVREYGELCFSGKPGVEQ